MNKPDCLRTPIKDEEKTWLNSNEPSMFAFTPRKMELECKTHCKDYDACKKTKDDLMMLLARNFSNLEKKPQRFNSDFYNLDDR
jgi:hypothetical protein